MNEKQEQHAYAAGFHEMMVRYEAEEKAPYWKAVGSVILGEELGQKWCSFVDENVKGIGAGVLLDETLQVMTMIKAGVQTDAIKEVLNNIGSKGTVIDYLSGLFHPEILSSIDTEIRK